MLGSKSRVISLKQWLGAEETDLGANNILSVSAEHPLIIKIFLSILSSSSLNLFQGIGYFCLWLYIKHLHVHIVLRRMQQKNHLHAEQNSKSILRRAQGSTEQEKGDVKLFEFSVETPTPQVKHKLFKTVEQVHRHWDWNASCKHCFFKAFTPARAQSSYVPLALKNVPGNHATQQLFSSAESGTVTMRR